MRSPERFTTENTENTEKGQEQILNEVRVGAPEGSCSLQGPCLFLLSAVVSVFSVVKFSD